MEAAVATHAAAAEVDAHAAAVVAAAGVVEVNAMRSKDVNKGLLATTVCFCVATVLVAGAQSERRTFAEPQQAADVLVAAARTFDVGTLEQLFGSGFRDTVLSGEYAQDRQRATDFVAKADEKMRVSVDPKTRTVRARAVVYNPTGQLKPGTFGLARIPVNRESAVTAPAAALQTSRRDDRPSLLR